MEYKAMAKINNINEVNKKLEKNYIKNLKEFVNNLKQKGFIILIDDAGNRHINQYNVRLSEFVPSTKYTSIPAIADEMQKEITNYYAIQFDYSFYIDIVTDTLPTITVDELNAFYDYNKAKKNITNEKELKKDFKELENVIKDRTRKLNTTNDDVFEQMQVLINEGIVSASVGDGFFKKIKYYRFNTKDNVFDKVTAEDIQQLLEKELNISLNIRIIQKHMSKDWKTYGISSQLPVKWNNNLKYQKQLYELENNKLTKIINTYI